MKSSRAHSDELNPILEFSEDIYTDDYKGGCIPAKLVDVFPRVLNKTRLVNQPGSDTVYCKDHQIPPFDSFEGYEQFFDVKSGGCRYHKGHPDLYVTSKYKRLSQVEINRTIHGDITETYPLHVIREINEYSGVGQINPGIWMLMGTAFNGE